MSIKLSKIKFFKVNGDLIIAPKTLSTAGVKLWYEKTDGREADEVQVVSLTDKTGMEKGAPTWAQVIEQTDFEADDLPMFL